MRHSPSATRRLSSRPRPPRSCRSSTARPATSRRCSMRCLTRRSASGSNVRQLAGMAAGGSARSRCAGCRSICRFSEGGLPPQPQAPPKRHPERRAFCPNSRYGRVGRPGIGEGGRAIERHRGWSFRRGHSRWRTSGKGHDRRSSDARCGNDRCGITRLPGTHGEPKTPTDLHRHLCINWRFPGSGALHRWRFEKGARSLRSAWRER